MSGSPIEGQAVKRTGVRLWLFELDRILRGEATRPTDIAQADIKIPVLGIAAVVIVLGMIYGFCMGIFSLVHGMENNDYHRALAQTFASMCKVPLLFLLTLIVTFPSLYVFNALVGSQLRMVPVFKLLIASMAVNLAVLASLGPILAFFSVSTPNYSFIVLLNVVVFSVAGVLGLIFLIQTLNRLALAEQGSSFGRDARVEGVPDAEVVVVAPLDVAEGQPTAEAPGKVPAARPTPSSLGHPADQAAHLAGPLIHPTGVVLGTHVRKVFGCWIVLFGLVGAQMGWVLRPFIGSPSQPFQWFRARHSNFFEAVWHTIQNLF